MIETHFWIFWLEILTRTLSLNCAKSLNYFKQRNFFSWLGFDNCVEFLHVDSVLRVTTMRFVILSKHINNRL